MQTTEEIEAWWRESYSELQDLHGRFGVPSEKEIELSDEYKRRHNELISARLAAEKQAKREELASETRVCELCGTSLPIRRGRPAKRCEDCK